MNFPQELIQKKKWICWREETRDENKTKVPINPLNGKYASTTDSETWTDYETAKNAHESGKIQTNGLGFVFTADDLIVGVDLDKCRDPDTGELEGFAEDIMQKLDSYTEVSPSGTGIHVIVQGVIPGENNRKDGVEIYETNRFFTMTGDHIQGTEKEVKVRAEELKQVYFEYLEEQKNQQNTTTQPASKTDLDDDDILEKAFNADNGDKFQSLWRGNTSMYGGDHSRADQALCNLLAFWTGGDRTQIDQLFRQSGLCRDKWTKRQDYRERTINNAIESCNEFYEPGKEIPDIKEIIAEPDKNKIQPIDWKKIQELIDDNDYDDGKARQILADALCQKHNFVTMADTQKIHNFANPVYTQKGETIIKKELKQNLDGLTTHDRNEVLNQVRIETEQDRPKRDECPHIIPVKNGHFNINTMELEEPDPDRFLVNEIPITYNADADCPQIKDFVSEIVEEENIPLIQEMFGYCLYRAYPYRKAFMLLGEGQNGKSQLLKLLSTFLGQDNLSTPNLHQLTNNRFAKSNLYAKLANVNGDIDSDKLDRTGNFKQLTGDDIIHGEMKGIQEPLKFYNYAKLIFAANELPGVGETTDAFFSRWILIEFPYKFTNANDDHKDAVNNIADKITTEEELQGLFNWAVKGLNRLIDDGFTKTQSAKKVKTRWLLETEPVEVFAEKMLIRDDGNFVQTQDLYDFYCDFCEYHGAWIEDKMVFCRKLNNTLDYLRPSRPKIHGERKTGYKNIRFKKGMVSVFRGGDNHVRGDRGNDDVSKRTRARGVNEQSANILDTPDAIVEFIKVSDDDLVDEVVLQEELDLSFDEMEEALGVLSRDGVVFEPKSGFWGLLE